MNIIKKDRDIIRKRGIINYYSTIITYLIIVIGTHLTYNIDKEVNIVGKVKIDVATVIKEARNNKGYTLRELGKLTGLSHSFLGDIETGRSRPSYENLIIIIGVLDIPLEKIFLPQKYENNEQTKSA